MKGEKDRFGGCFPFVSTMMRDGATDRFLLGHHYYNKNCEIHPIILTFKC